MKLLETLRKLILYFKLLRVQQLEKVYDGMQAFHLSPETFGVELFL